MPIFAFYVGEGNWRDRVIRLATRSDESHIEFVVGGVLNDVNYCISASKRDGAKVRGKNIEWNPQNWIFFDVPGDNGQIFERLMLEMGKPYDTLGALLSVTPISRHKEGAWFCSELMAHALGLKNPHHYTPGKLRALFMSGAESIGSA